MSNTFEKYWKVGQEELRRLINSRLRHQKKRTYTEVPNMELPNGNECATKPSSRCRKLANPSMVGTKPSWKDGTTRTNTASLCQKLGGLENNLFSMTHLHWNTTPILQREEIVMRKNWYSSWMKKVLKDQWINDRISLKQNERWKRLHDEHAKETSEGNTPFILYNDQDSKGATNLKDLKSIFIKSTPKQDGEPILRSHGETCRGIQHIRPRQINGRMIGSRTKVGILGDPHPGLNRSDFSVQRCLLFLSLVGKWIPWQSTGVWTGTPAARHIHTCTVTPQNTQDMCTMAEGAGRRKGFLCAHIGHSSTRHVCSFVARDTEHFLTFSFFYLSCVVVVFFSEPRPVVHVSNYPLRRSTAGWLLRNTPPPQVMSPKGSSSTGFWSNHKIKELTTRMVLKNLVSKSCPTVYQFTIRQKALRRRPTRTSKTSNYVSCWLHHCIDGNERKMKDKHELITLNEKAWWSSLLGILKYQGKLMRSVYRSEEKMHNEHKLITQDEKAWWQVRLESSKFQGRPK